MLLLHMFNFPRHYSIYQRTVQPHIWTTNHSPSPSNSHCLGWGLGRVHGSVRAGSVPWWCWHKGHGPWKPWGIYKPGRIKNWISKQQWMYTTNWTIWAHSTEASGSFIYTTVWCLSTVSICSQLQYKIPSKVNISGSVQCIYLKISHINLGVKGLQKGTTKNFWSRVIWGSFCALVNFNTDGLSL